MPSDVEDIVALAFNYLEGLRAANTTTPEQEARAFQEYLLERGCVIRRRLGAERVRPGSSLQQNRNVPAAGIRAERTRLGLSLAELARMTGLSGKTLKNTEEGTTSPQAHTLDVILQVLASRRTEVDGPDNN